MKLEVYTVINTGFVEVVNKTTGLTTASLMVSGYLHVKGVSAVYYKYFPQLLISFLKLLFINIVGIMRVNLMK